MATAYLPNLHALRAFEAAARHESFQKAAEELGLTPSAISRHVRTLEAELGHPLFERLHRAVVLTADGGRYAARLTAAFGEMAVRPSGQLRQRIILDVDAELLRLWLLPRLTPEALDALDLDAVLRARADRPRMLPADTDLALVWGALDYDGFKSRPLLRPRVFAVAAPSLGLRSLPDVARARLLHDRDEQWWRAMHEAASLPYPSSAPTLTFDRCDMPIEAARAGLGVAVGDDVIAGADLRSGALMRLDGPVLESRSYQLLVRRSRRTAAAGRLVDWITAEAEAFSKGS
jgi:LysR family glycine cleavage system transcriptional activator